MKRKITQTEIKANLELLTDTTIKEQTPAQILLFERKIKEARILNEIKAEIEKYNKKRIK